MTRITEENSKHRNLEQKSTAALLTMINQEDETVAGAIKDIIPAIIPLVDDIYDHMLGGGRLIYIGSGTSGRLGIVDASECPPTFGVDPGLVIGIIAGGDQAIRKAQEFAEDDREQGWIDLQKHNVNKSDVILGLSASGTTPYVVAALEKCQANKILTACITCNPDVPILQFANHPIKIIVGPEFITGSTRMKAGTAEKLILNMISTAVMIKLGRVHDNKMVDMQLTNEKLIDRGTLMVAEALIIDYDKAKGLLLEHGSVRMAINAKK